MIDEGPYKRMLRRLYRTRLGQLGWRLLSAFISHPAVQMVIDKALESSVRHGNFPEDKVLLPRIAPLAEPGEKAVLLLVPFLGPDASSNYTTWVCQRFVEAGYRVDTVLYSQNNWQPEAEGEGEIFHIRSCLPDYGLQQKQMPPGELDCNGVDDWCGPDLIQFVAALSHLRSYRFCLVSYVFLSGALEVLPASTARVILTSDVFTGRNSRIRAAGDERSLYYFSTSAEEERRGLQRADLVLAITEQDGAYFREKLGLDKVCVLPYLPPVTPLAAKTHTPGAPLVVGYIASAHRPNIIAIDDFVRLTAPLDGFELHIAGGICGQLRQEHYPARVKLLDFVDDLADFYRQCDLVVNPDELASGLKIKCVEALAYGRPLLCTRAASQGLGATSPYHLAETREALSAQLAELIASEEKQQELRRESQHLFDRFNQRYRDAISMETYEKLWLARNQTAPGQRPREKAAGNDA